MMAVGKVAALLISRPWVSGSDGSHGASRSQASLVPCPATRRSTRISNLEQQSRSPEPAEGRLAVKRPSTGSGLRLLAARTAYRTSIVPTLRIPSSVGSISISTSSSLWFARPKLRMIRAATVDGPLGLVRSLAKLSISMV